MSEHNSQPLDVNRFLLGLYCSSIYALYNEISKVSLVSENAVYLGGAGDCLVDDLISLPLIVGLVSCHTNSKLDHHLF